MSARLEYGGHLVDRARTVGFRWNGRNLQGLAGDTLASALLANGVTLVGRSFKYHRPRGIVASGVEEPNALVGLGSGGRFEPNARATTIDLRRRAGGGEPEPLAEPRFDLGAAGARLAPLFPAGFYYKTFIRAARRLEAPVRAGDPPLGRARRRAGRGGPRRATSTATPTSTCWWWAAASPASPRRGRRARRARA